MCQQPTQSFFKNALGLPLTMARTAPDQSWPPTGRLRG